MKYKYKFCVVLMYKLMDGITFIASTKYLTIRKILVVIIYQNKKLNK